MIKIDEKNVRKHDDKNKKAIACSLQENGAGRSVLIDANDVLVAGNGVYEQAQKLKMPIRIVETDGTELIAIKRSDLSSDDVRRKALAIADNRCSDLSEFNDEKLAKMIEELRIADFTDSIGFDQNKIAKLLTDTEVLIPEKPEVDFSEELMEHHNYIVLYFDNEIDWLQAQSLFKIKTVKDSKMFGKTERRGIGRVLRGAEAINQLLEATK